MVEGVTGLNNSALLIQAGEGVQPSLPPSLSKTKKTEPDALAQTAGGVRSDDVSISISAGNKGENERGNTTQTTVDEEKLDEKKLEESIAELNDKLYDLNRQVQFRVDKTINRSYISIIDKQTKEVIKEIPPEAIRHLIAQLREFEENSQYNGGATTKDLFVNVEV